MSKKAKIAVRFAVILVAAGLVGYLVGRLLSGTEWEIPDSVIDTLGRTVTIVFWVCNIVVCACSWCLYIREKKLYESRKDDEEVLDRLEYTLSIPILLSNIVMVLNFFFFALTMFWIAQGLPEENGSLSFMQTGCWALVFGMVWITLLQGRIVALEKKINPEKKGYVLDFRFQKDWFASCDEAQRNTICKAAYTSFKATNLVCMFCWIVCFIGVCALNSGVLPIILLTAIHMTLIVTFTLSCMKQERPQSMSKE